MASSVCRFTAPLRRRLAVALAGVGMVLLALGMVWLHRHGPGAVAPAETDGEPARFSFLAMGTVGEIAVAGASAEAAAAAADAAQARIDALEEDFSVFRPDSLVSRLNRGEAVSLSEEGRCLFGLALRVAEASGGAFDPTVGPLLRTWGLRGGVVREQPPEEAEIAAVLDHVGWRRLHLVDGAGGEVLARLEKGAELDFGGVAKGLAVDRAYEAARAALAASGAPDAGLLVNLGGNMRAFGAPRHAARAWSVAIRDPFLPFGQGSVGTLSLSNGLATATSGSYERFIDIQGIRHSHIIDPRCGRPVRGLAQATVVARTAAEADALSTACFVLGPGESAPLLAAFPGAEAFFVLEDGAMVPLSSSPAGDR